MFVTTSNDDIIILHNFIQIKNRKRRSGRPI